MHDTNKILRAEQYIKKMKDGINPITGLKVSENDLINNARIKECFVYIQSVLREIIAKDGMIKYVPYFITDEQKSMLSPTENHALLYDFIDMLNKFAEENGCAKLHHTHISCYLTKIGFCNNDKMPNEVGNSNGVIKTTLNRNNRDYNVLALEPAGQEYLISQLDNIIEFINSGEYLKLFNELQNNHAI